MKYLSRFKKSLPYTWYLYALAIIAPSVAYPLTYSFMFRPQNFETISIFVSSNYDQNFISNLETEFEGSSIRKFEVVSCNYKDSIYLEKLTVVGYSRCDILILPESILTHLDIGEIAIELDDNIKSTIGVTNANYYKMNDIEYGIKIEQNNMMNNYINFDNTTAYYALFCGNSANIGEYSNSTITTNNAFDVMKYLFE